MKPYSSGIFPASAAIVAAASLLCADALADETAWIGASNANWSVAANWNNGLPSNVKTGMVENGDYVNANSNMVATIALCNGGTVAAGVDMDTAFVMRGGVLRIAGYKRHVRGPMLVEADSFIHNITSTDPTFMDGLISGSAKLTVITLSGTLQLEFTTNNVVFTGGMDVYGRISMGHTNAFGSGEVRIFPNGCVYLGVSPGSFRNFTLAGGHLSCGQTRTSAGTLTLTADSFLDCEWSANILTQTGPIVGNYRVIKGGSGAVSLAAPSPAWTGGADVNNNVLRITAPGSQGTGSIFLYGGTRIEFNAGQSWSDDIDWTVANNIAGHGVVQLETGSNSIHTLTVAGAAISPGGRTNEIGRLTINGKFKMDALYSTRSVLAVSINGANNYDQLAVNGSVVNLNGQQLAVSLDYNPDPGAEVYILLNDGINPILGTFEGLPEGAILDLGAGYTARISYMGNGDGGSVANDVKLYDFGYTAAGPVLFID